MMGIKWFSGGKERREAALPIFEELIASMEKNKKKEPLKALLVKYRQELKTSGTSTPFIFNQMNIELVKVMADNHIVLSKEQSDLFKALQQLSAIRYGYY